MSDLIKVDKALPDIVPDKRGELIRFYKRAMRIAVPIMIQNGITNFVGMLDNIMVGRVGTTQMSGVAIINQLMFIWNLCLFGALAGIGIYTAQFYGKGDHKSIRYTLRLQIIAGALLCALGIALFFVFRTQIISLYLTDKNSSAAVKAATMRYAKEYLYITLFGLVPFAATQVYASTLRSCGETVVPMRAGIIAVVVNLVGNYLLIYGKFGFPVMGVEGAALATVISRFVEASYVIMWSHKNTERHPYFQGTYRSLYIPRDLAGKCIRKALPLLFNEGIWAGGISLLTIIYSGRSLDVVPAANISSTLSNVFNVAFIAMGSAAGIIIGQELGSGDHSTVHRDANRLAIFSVLLCVIAGLMMICLAWVFPRIYNTTDEVRSLATGYILISGAFMPFYAYGNAAYFTIRAGGKTMLTVIFDSCFLWLLSVPLGFILTKYTGLHIVLVFLLVQSLEILKSTLGYLFMRSNIWVRDITVYNE